MAVQKAITQACVPVGADVVGRKHTAIDLVQRNVVLTHLQPDDIVVGYFGFTGSVDPG